MASHNLTFGVFVPRGWKMELVSIEDHHGSDEMNDPPRGGGRGS